MAWSYQDLETAKKMWLEDGCSAQQIARALGGGKSRNAVIGIVHRKGWERGVRAGRPKQHNQSRAATPLFGKPVFADNVVRLIPKNRQQVIDETNGMQLYGPINDFPHAGMCRYIPGDPATGHWRCCGYPTGDLSNPTHREGDVSKPWCDAHLVVVAAPRGAGSGTPHDPTAPYVFKRTGLLAKEQVAVFDAHEEGLAALGTTLSA